MINKIIAAAVLTALLTGCGHSEQSTISEPKKTSSDVPPATVAAAVPLNNTVSVQTTAASATKAVITATLGTETSAASSETTVSAAEMIEPETEPEPVQTKSVQTESVQTETVTTEAQEITASAEVQYETFFGILIDEDCSDFEDPPSHDLPCMLMDECRASGYGLDIQQEDGSWIFYMFDKNGQDLSWEYLMHTSRMDGLYVTVTGKWEENVIKVIDLKEC